MTASLHERTRTHTHTHTHARTHTTPQERVDEEEEELQQEQYEEGECVHGVCVGPCCAAYTGPVYSHCMRSAVLWGTCGVVVTHPSLCAFSSCKRGLDRADHTESEVRFEECPSSCAFLSSELAHIGST